MKTHSHGDQTWRCDACGAFNDEPLQVCSECKAERLDTSSSPRARKTRGKAKQPKSKAAKPRVSKRKETKEKPGKAPETKASTEDGSDQELTGTDFDVESPTGAQPELPEAPEPLAPAETLEEDVQVPDEDVRAETGESHQDYIIGGPSEKPQEEQVAAEPTPAVATFASQPESSISGEGHYGLVYINSPVSELIKRKIDVDFESFPVISIGRSPENVIVVPDAGVSRTHAELSKEGGRVMLKDCQSSNGTYAYDGKEFQKVSDSIELKPNTLVKLGTGTILRFTVD